MCIVRCCPGRPYVDVVLGNDIYRVPAGSQSVEARRRRISGLNLSDWRRSGNEDMHPVAFSVPIDYGFTRLKRRPYMMLP